MAWIQRNPVMKITKVNSKRTGPMGVSYGSVYKLPKITPKSMGYTGLPKSIPRLKSVPDIFAEEGRRYRRDISRDSRRLV